MAESLARHVKELIDREYGGVQRRAEIGLKISQSHLSALMRPEDRRGPGLDVLLRLRAVTRKSIDELLGLPPLQDNMDARIRSALAEMLGRKPPQLPPSEVVLEKEKGKHD